jgi:hypothetical protein
MNKKVVALTATLAITMTACEKNNRSFSLLSQSQSFQQSASTFTQKKVDILWVVDNSGSMQTSQANLATSFSSFINQFQTLGIDYHMAVTTTSAYMAGSYFNNAQNSYMPNNAKFMDGSTDSYGLGHTGIFVMNPQNTTAAIFQKNIMVGIPNPASQSTGDERAFSSFVQALIDPTNVASGFRRSDAFLSIIILSDEDDFSGNASQCDHFDSRCATHYVGDKNYNAGAPYLQPVSYYTGWLDTYAGGHGNYSVNSIYADSAACILDLNNGANSTSRVIGQRYQAISTATSGIAASLCSNFGTTLASISKSVLELASVFKLTQIPNVSTIFIVVNGNVIPENAVNGWTYDATSNSIYFHGNAVPAAGANIQVGFTPVGALNL